MMTSKIIKYLDPGMLGDQVGRVGETIDSRTIDLVDRLKASFFHQNIEFRKEAFHHMSHTMFTCNAKRPYP